MPIRTNRGRAAVYRRLWGWPMRSPRHLSASLLVFAAVLLFVGLIVPRLTGVDGRANGGAPDGIAGGSSSVSSGSGGLPSGGAAPGGQPAQSSPSSSLPTRLPAQPPPSTTDAPAPADALDVANKWGQAWVNHPAGITNEQWLAGLRPYTTEERIAVMSTVDPANVPATKVTGPPVTRANYVSSVTVALPTDHGQLNLSIILTPQGWRVAEYDEQAA